MRILFAALRLLVAGLVVAAVIGQLGVSLDNWRAAGIDDPTVQVVNFFSFFTIESNIASVVVLTIGAVLLLRGPGRGGAGSRARIDPTSYTGVRAAIVSYMVVTGIVYNLLLRGIELPQGTTLPWSNEVLHVVAPVYLLLDWLLAPGRGPLRSRTVWAVVVFPLVWAVYTLVRGPLTFDAVTGADHWYPYPFLNPATSANGYSSVAFYVVLIAVVIAVVAMGVVRLSRTRLPAASRSA